MPNQFVSLILEQVLSGSIGEGKVDLLSLIGRSSSPKKAFFDLVNTARSIDGAVVFVKKIRGSHDRPSLFNPELRGVDRKVRPFGTVDLGEHDLSRHILEEAHPMELSGDLFEAEKEEGLPGSVRIAPSPSLQGILEGLELGDEVEFLGTGPIHQDGRVVDGLHEDVIGVSTDALSSLLAPWHGFSFPLSDLYGSHF